MSFCSTRCTYCVKKSEGLTYTEPPNLCVDRLSGFEVYANRHSLTDLSETERYNVNYSYSAKPTRDIDLTVLREDTKFEQEETVRIPTIVISHSSSDTLDRTSRSFCNPPEQNHSETDVRDTRFMRLDVANRNARWYSSSPRSSSPASPYSETKSGSSFFSTELRSASSTPSVLELRSSCSTPSFDLSPCDRLTPTPSEDHKKSILKEFTFNDSGTIGFDEYRTDGPGFPSTEIRVFETESADTPVKCVLREKPILSRSLYSLTFCPFYARSSLFPLPRSSLPLPIRFGIMDEDTFIRFYGRKQI